MNRPMRPVEGRTSDTELRILLDLDGTTVDWLHEYEMTLRSLDSTATLIDPYAYNVFDRYEAQPDAIQEALDTLDYRSLRFLPGAAQAIREMREAGHEVTFASAPTPSHPTCVEEKRDWIEKHFGVRMAEEAHIVLDKTSLRGDVLIDDHPALSGAVEPTFQQVLYRQRYNRGVQKPVLLHWRWWADAVKAVA